jgi:hypothetical protein
MDINIWVPGGKECPTKEINKVIGGSGQCFIKLLSVFVWKLFLVRTLGDKVPSKFFDSVLFA